MNTARAPGSSIARCSPREGGKLTAAEASPAARPRAGWSGRGRRVAIERGRRAPRASPRPIAGPGGTPAASRSLPSIGGADVTQLGQPSDRRSAGPERAGERDRLGGRPRRSPRRARTAAAAAPIAAHSSGAGAAARTIASRSSAANAEPVEQRARRRPGPGAARRVRARAGRGGRRSPSSSSALAAQASSVSRSRASIAASSPSSRSAASAAIGSGSADAAAAARCRPAAPLTVSSASAPTASRHELERPWLGREAQPRGVPRQPQQPRRVVAEAAGVQHSQPLAPEVCKARLGPPRARPRRRRPAQRDRVDREVAPHQVLRRAAPASPRAAPRVRVRLGPRGCEVEPQIAERQLGGPEPLVRALLAAEPRRRRGRASPSTTRSRSSGVTPEQEITHGARRPVRPGPRPESARRSSSVRRRRLAGEPVEQLGGGSGLHVCIFARCGGRRL